MRRIASIGVVGAGLLACAWFIAQPAAEQVHEPQRALLGQPAETPSAVSAAPAASAVPMTLAEAAPRALPSALAVAAPSAAPAAAAQAAPAVGDGPVALIQASHAVQAQRAEQLASILRVALRPSDNCPGEVEALTRIAAATDAWDTASTRSALRRVSSERMTCGTVRAALSRSVAAAEDVSLLTPATVEAPPAVAAPQDTSSPPVPPPVQQIVEQQPPAPEQRYTPPPTSNGPVGNGGIAGGEGGPGYREG